MDCRYNCNATSYKLVFCRINDKECQTMGDMNMIFAVKLKAFHFINMKN